MPANTLAVGPAGQELDENKVVPRKQVISWAFWDWATQPFNSVILTFVFASLYLVSDNFLPADIAALAADDPIKQRALADLSAGYGLATTLAGILILLLAPVLGQRADASGNKKRMLAALHRASRSLQFGLFFVYAEPSYFMVRRDPAGPRGRRVGDRRRQLQRDAGAGVQPQDDRQGQRTRLGTRVHRRHRRSGHRRRVSPSRTGSAWTPPTASPIGSSRSAALCGRSCSPCRCWLNVPEAPPSGNRPPRGRASSAATSCW